MNSNDLYIIIQAGGRGSRLRHHTWNKPKCLVSVHGKPILYHIFDFFPNANFIIIGDYLFNTLKEYLQITPPKVKYQLIEAKEKGTTSGIADALKYVPSDSRLLLLWSDIVIHSLPEISEADVPTILITSAFTCRWTIDDNGKLHEKPGSKNGIPGLFYFSKASLFPPPPKKGEFVKWFSININNFKLLDCPNIEELGDFNTIEENNNREGFCRFFNKVDIFDDIVIKTVIDSDYIALHEKEIDWYKEAKKLGFRRIPNIFNTSPLTLHRINGKHAYQIEDLTLREQRALMADYLDALISLHDSAESITIVEDIKDVYIEKTINRVQSVSHIIPGFTRDSITVNGRKCRNPFSIKYEGLFDLFLKELIPNKFVPIHGDPTFSNTLIDDNLRVWFIDPRGYFSKKGIMGDAWYDFAKVYYSAVGGYDSFNRRKFKLYIDKDTVEILMDTPSFAKVAQPIFYSYFGKNMKRIEILHGLIWLALSGYAKDDIDSIIGSFYLGLYWLESGSAIL